MEETNNINLENKESVELELTAKGLYKWTIKLREITLGDSTIMRLVWLNDRMIKEYPNNVLSGLAKQ